MVVVAIVGLLLPVERMVWDRAEQSGLASGYKDSSLGYTAMVLFNSLILWVIVRVVVPLAGRPTASPPDQIAHRGNDDDSFHPPAEAPTMRLSRLQDKVRGVLAYGVIALPFVGLALVVMRQNSFSSAATTHAVRESFFHELSLSLAGEPDAQEIASDGGYLPDDATRVRIEGDGPGRRVFCPADSDTPLDETAIADLVQTCRRAVEHERRLRIKYQQAARSPWMPVSADPPRPD